MRRNKRKYSTSESSRNRLIFVILPLSVWKSHDFNWFLMDYTCTSKHTGKYETANDRSASGVLSALVEGIYDDYSVDGQHNEAQKEILVRRMRTVLDLFHFCLR